MTHRIACCLAAVLLLHSPASSEQPKGKKYALLVGVKAYNHDKLNDLKHTENDAEQLAKLLSGREAGFAEVVLLTTARGADKDELKPTAANFRKQLKRLLDKVTKHDLILIGLAGHGLQITVTDPDTRRDKDESFFCPADAKPRDTKDFAELKKTMIPLGETYKELDESGAGTKLVLVDACRNEVDLTRRGRSVNADTTPKPPQGTAVLFSCKSGEQAFETDKLGGGHGVFFHYVIQGMKGAAKNRDGKVTWNGLTEYVTTQVPQAVPVLIGGGAAQSPQEIKNVVGPPPLLLQLKPDERVAVASDDAQADRDYLRGMDLSMGTNVDKIDYALAVKHLERSSDGGHTLGKVALAVMVAYGRGIDPDEERAEKLIRAALPRLRKLAQEGNADANNLLGVIYQDGLGVVRDDEESFKHVKKAAEGKLPVAMSNLGSLYFAGIGTAKDYKAAFEWYQKGAEKGQASAMSALGWAYLTGGGVKRDEREGFRWISLAATKNDPAGIASLGYCYVRGLGVKQDEKHGFALLRRAAQLNDPTVLVVLGAAYEYGNGVAADTKAAVEYYRRASDRRDPMGRAALGKAYRYGAGGLDVDEEKAVRLFKHAADRGSANGQEYLGAMHEFGRGGLRRDAAEAAKWYRKSADGGWHPAMVRVGKAHFFGELGMKRDAKEAVAWFRKAADAGDAAGMGWLGECYLAGAGANKDAAEGLRWSKKAEALNDPLGTHNVGWCQEHGLGGLKADPAAAVKTYEKSAAQGHVMSHSNLGILYYQGRGVKANQATAFKHFKFAADKGLMHSQHQVAHMYEYGQGTQVNAVLSLFYYKKAADQGHAGAKKRLQDLGVTK